MSINRRADARGNGPHFMHRPHLLAIPLGSDNECYVNYQARGELLAARNPLLAARVWLAAAARDCYGRYCVVGLAS